MSIFNDIGKKLSQTGQMAVQKTKDMTDTVKLNSEISDEEKKINNGYLQIGQLYYSLHSEDCEPSFLESVNSIKQSQAKIEENKKQIEALKGVKCCTNCGADIPNSATFCSNCGVAVMQYETKDISNMIICSSCGKMIEKDMHFCTCCGVPVKQVADVDDEQKYDSLDNEELDNSAPCTKCGAETITPTERNNLHTDVIVDDSASLTVQKESPIGKTCSNCGANIKPDAAFCTVCGSKI